MIKHLMTLAFTLFSTLTWALPLADYWDPGCGCYRDVVYGKERWEEPTRDGAKTKQRLDIWMPGPSAPTYAGGRPVVFWAHPNGVTHSIGFNTGPDSNYSRLIKPLTDLGFILVAYEFRHPAVNDPLLQPPNDKDPQTAINWVLDQNASELGADARNVFLSGSSRGGGMSVWTALVGQFTAGTVVRGAWVYNAQTTFNCVNAADTFIIPASQDGGVERSKFLARADCWANPALGSSLIAAGPQVSSPPMVVRYKAQFFNRTVTDAEMDIHHPDYGLALCAAYAQSGTESCTAQDSVSEANKWVGMAQWFVQRLVP